MPHSTLGATVARSPPIRRSPFRRGPNQVQMRSVYCPTKAEGYIYSDSRRNSAIFVGPTPTPSCSHSATGQPYLLDLLGHLHVRTSRGPHASWPQRADLAMLSVAGRGCPLSRRRHTQFASAAPPECGRLAQDPAGRSHRGRPAASRIVPTPTSSTSSTLATCTHGSPNASVPRPPYTLWRSYGLEDRHTRLRQWELLTLEEISELLGPDPSTAQGWARTARSPRTLSRPTRRLPSDPVVSLRGVVAGIAHNEVKNRSLHVPEDRRAMLQSLWYVDNTALGESVFLIIHPEFDFPT
jgi:hypothetical protein